MLAGQAAALVIPAPPAAPVVPPEPSPRQRFWAQVLGTAPRSGEPLFPAYTEMRKRLPLKAWHGIRIASVLAYLALCVTLFVGRRRAVLVLQGDRAPAPDPVLHGAGAVAQHLPLAASNQAPRGSALPGRSPAGLAPPVRRRHLDRLFFGSPARASPSSTATGRA